MYQSVLDIYRTLIVDLSSTDTRDQQLAVKAYISNIFPWWTVERQIAVLSATVPNWPTDVAVFEDQLNRFQRRTRDVSNLIDRAKMLRPTIPKEPDIIYVASLAVLGLDETDFNNIAQTILMRNGTIEAIDDRVTVTKDTALTVAIKNWIIARRKSRIAVAQQKGARVSADRRKAIAAQGVEKIRQYWGMSSEEWPTWKLRKMAGTETRPMAYNTIVEHLGVGRELAQKRYQAAARRKVTLAEKQKELA